MQPHLRQRRRRPFTEYAHRVGIVLLVPGLCLLLSACKVDLYQNLSEQDANIMLATLLKHGIPAEKVSAGKLGFKVSVDEDRLIQSLEVLRTNSLPREAYKSMGSVFSGEGMISSATEEQARLSFAISQELSDTFSRIDGVLTSRVHVVLASTDASTGQRTPPSAAVFLRHTPESLAPNMVAKIRETAARSVPGLNYDQVTVMLVPVRDAVGVPMRPQPSFLDRLFAPETPLKDILLRFALPFILSVLCVGSAVACLLARRRRAGRSEPAVKE